MKRQILPDLLKGFAAVFMVQVHITELFLDDASRGSTLGTISLFLGGPFAAVIFMVVMGYFIFKNKNTTIQNLLRGVKIFMLGLFLNVGLNFNLLLKIYNSGWQYNPFEYIFGVDILYLAGLSIIVLTLLKRNKIWQLYGTPVLLLLVIVLTGFVNTELTRTQHYYLLPFIAGNYSWSYFPLFPWLAYPLTGFLLAQHETQIRSFLSGKKMGIPLIGLLFALIAIVFMRQGVQTTINLPSYYHHPWWFVLWALSISLLWAAALSLLQKLFPETRAENLLLWIGKNITLFYVIQWLIIGNIATAIYQTQSLNTWLYWLVAIFTASILFTYLMRELWHMLFSKIPLR